MVKLIDGTLLVGISVDEQFLESKLLMFYGTTYDRVWIKR